MTGCLALVGMPENFLLPSGWSQQVAPLMLLGLVMVGIMLPLAVASWYMLRGNRFAGARCASGCCSLGIQDWWAG